jgi:NAD(P)-dependent dehydrogenase (short-subunit alcohol dehydrogenase family)
MGTLDSRVVIVTGAAGNLGRATAAAMRVAGAQTVLVDAREADIREAHPAAAGDPAQLVCGDTDLTDEAAAGAVVAKARERFGRVDVLVNTVGGFRGGKAVQEEALATWDLMMSLNLRTTLLTCRAALPGFIDQGSGAIVNVAAGAALATPAGLAAYSASKSAVIRLTEALAAEGKAHGVRANAVLPSTIDTPQNRSAMPKADFSKWVAPEAIADVIVFLVSDAARAVTGVALPVFGRA